MLLAVFTQLVAKCSERNAQELCRMRAIAVGLFQRGHNELALHLAHRVTRLDRRVFRTLDVLIEQIGRRDL